MIDYAMRDDTPHKQQSAQAMPAKQEPEAPEHIPSSRKEKISIDLGDQLEASSGYLGNQPSTGKRPLEDAPKPAVSYWMQTRIQVALLGLAIAVVNCYAQATFCIAIVEMVLPADYVIRAGDSKPLISVTKNSTTIMASSSSNDPLANEDQSCPIEYKYRDYYDDWRFQALVPASGFNSNASRVTEQPISRVDAGAGSAIDMTNRFDWDASHQGLLLGAFAIGTAPLQVVGGRLAEVYGAKWVLLAGCIGTALTNLTIPFLAHFSFLLLIVNRVLMGITQAGMEPGLMCLLAEWLTPAETSFFISMLLFAICVGFFLGSLCSSFILALGYGWPLAYYVAGGMNLLVAVIWSYYASSRPRDSSLISTEELRFIEQQQQKEKQIQVDEDDLIRLRADSQSDISRREQQATDTPGNPQEQAPWLNILSTRSVWAFIICKISIRWCADVLSIELPTYLANVLHLSIKLNGILNSVSSALFAVFSFITGYLVNEILQTQQMNPNTGEMEICLGGSSFSWMLISKTALRKLFQSVASFGAALTVFLMTQYDCNILFSMSMLLVLSCCLVMGTGGELQIPYDMTSKYPGTLHGMACTLSVSGWLAPPLIGLILGDQPSSRYRWSLVWYLTAFINLVGGLVFVLFADASPRVFDGKEKRATGRLGEPGDDAKEHGDEHDFMDADDKQQQAVAQGYYNAACKSTDNTTPPLLPRTMRNLQQRGIYSNHNDDDVAVDDYSDCDNDHVSGNGNNSTGLNRGVSAGGPKDNGSAAINKQSPVLGWEGEEAAAMSKIRASKLYDLNWTPRFDCGPIHIRQMEESFMKPNYLHNIDSIVSQTTIFPYVIKHYDDAHKDDRECIGHECPIKIHTLWSRLTSSAANAIRGNRKQFTFSSDDASCGPGNNNSQERSSGRNLEADGGQQKQIGTLQSARVDGKQRQFNHRPVEGYKQPERQRRTLPVSDGSCRNYDQQMIHSRLVAAGDDGTASACSFSAPGSTGMPMVTTKTITHL